MTLSSGQWRTTEESWHTSAVINPAAGRLIKNWPDYLKLIYHKATNRTMLLQNNYRREAEEARGYFLKGEIQVAVTHIGSQIWSVMTMQALCLTSPLADVSSPGATFVVIPFAAVYEYGQAVFTIIIIRVTCQDRRGNKCKKGEIFPKSPLVIRGIAERVWL